MEPVNGIIPGKGFHIKWLGLWADIAEGVSVQNIQEFGMPRTPTQVMLDLFQKKVGGWSGVEWVKWMCGHSRRRMCGRLGVAVWGGGGWKNVS